VVGILIEKTCGYTIRANTLTGSKSRGNSH
jgi:hypothetical protein